MALDSEADVLLFGGAAGSLKSFTLLLDAIQEIDNPRFKGIVFRKSYPELEEIIAQSYELYPHFGGVYNDAKHIWKFASGATIRFRYIAREKDVYKYQGAQYTFIGFDESTHFTEKCIRYLFTRARSTDSSLRIRVRMASNPGNEGHDFHFKMFLRGHCFHCNPELSASPGKLYWDTVWPSDDTPLSSDEFGKVSTAFIPGRVTDHSLLGRKYIQMLHMQNPVVAKALLAGCWNVFEGQYFSIWEPNRAGWPMVQPWQDIEYEWWWPHWVSCDFGFSQSSSSAGLFTRRPPYVQDMGNGRFKEWAKGRVYRLSEIVAPRLNSEDLANRILSKWVLDEAGQRIERRIIAMYLSPDAGKDTGLVGRDNIHTVKSQMNAILAPHGLAFENAATDRVGGAQRMYSMLRSGELVVCSNCRKTIEMIPSRVHDDDKENDVKKVKGSDLDDVYDEFRYGVYSPNFEADRPIEEKKHEVLADPDMDELNKKIRLKQVEMEHQDEQDPVVYGGKALRTRLARNKRKNQTPWREPKA